MDASGGHVAYVRSSSVRSAMLTAVHESPRSTAVLVADLDASESAVYGAANALADRGLLVESDGAWRPTGLGVLVRDCLERERRVQRLLAADEEYWERHDPSVVPPCHRRFGALEDATVLRAADADPHRVTRAVADRIRDAETVRVLASIYHREFATAVATCADARLVLDRTVVAEVADESPPDAATDVAIRVGDLPFSLTVTGDCALLSLPLLDGGYDAQTELVAESAAAVEWGRDLFEAYWADATPVEA